MLMNPSEKLAPGLTKEMTFTVEEKHAADHVGSGAMRVLATPWMIAFMEIAARTLLDEHLPEGYSSVGVALNIRHTAPAAIGAEVISKVQVKSVEGSQVMLDVAVWHKSEQIGGGEHERYVIDVARFLKRVERSK